MKYVVSFIILAVIFGGGAAFWYSREKAAAASATPAFQTEKVVRATLEKVITANGKIASNRDVDIKCQASGKVILLPFDVSDRVKVGDLLLELDPVDQQRSLDQAKAQVQASEARLAQARTALQVAELNLTTTTSRTEADAASSRARAADAKSKYERTLQLFNNKAASGEPNPLASKEEVETAHTTAMQADATVLSSEAALAELEQQKISLETRRQDIATATAQLSQDNAKRDLAKSQVDYCKVYVPDDETSKSADFRISALGSSTAPVQLGTIVQSGSSGFSGGTTVMTLSDVSHMYVLASVDESDVGQIADPSRTDEHQKARITVDMYPGIVFDGEVVRVAVKGVNTTNVVTFEVKIEVTSANKTLLKPEGTATARIIVAARPDVLTIPVGAFTRADRRSMNPDAATASAPAVADAAPAANPDTTATSAPATRRGRGGGGGRGRGNRGGGMLANPGTPMDGTVQVVGADNKPETRNVTVGLSDDISYEVIRGLEEDEAVVVNKTGGDSRWRNQQNGNLIPRGMPGGGGGGGGGGRR